MTPLLSQRNVRASAVSGLFQCLLRAELAYETFWCFALLDPDFVRFRNLTRWTGTTSCDGPLLSISVLQQPLPRPLEQYQISAVRSEVL